VSRASDTVKPAASGAHRFGDNASHHAAAQHAVTGTSLIGSSD
jgi:hypothetical protein